MNLIAHICSRQAWQQAQQDGQYQGDTLTSDGFIHCSKPEQILGVAERYFSGVRDLLILWIDPSKLAAELRWEASEGEVYPHIYGPLNLDAVSAVKAFDPDADGVYRTVPFIG